MSNSKELSGIKFGRLLVLHTSSEMYISPKGKKAAVMVCRCDCGEYVEVKRSQLVTGKTKSCGCIHREQLSQRNKKHGMAKTPEYISWQAMKARCTNPKASHYEFYGERGIKVCDRWLNSFDNFYADMGKRDKGMSLDRINPAGNYEPDNCRWATLKTQSENKRNSKIISFHGENRPLTEWAKLLQIKYETLRHRLYYYGWSVEKAFTTQIGGEK